MFDHLLEWSHRDDSNKWSNIGFGEEKTQVELIEVQFTHLIWSPVKEMKTHTLSGAMFFLSRVHQTVQMTRGAEFDRIDGSNTLP